MNQKKNKNKEIIFKVRVKSWLIKEDKRWSPQQAGTLPNVKNLT